MVDMTETRCPLLIHLSLPPLPEGVTLDQVLQYEQELANPTGILSSLKRPKGYWEGKGLGGVIVADQCGLVFGIDGGHGVPMDNFWRKTVHCKCRRRGLLTQDATFATLSQLLVLLLLVRQMERTRTPSTLAKVSLWTIVLISASDSAIFSGHIILGLFADNKTSLPLLIPGFMALCTAIVFGPVRDELFLADISGTLSFCTASRLPNVPSLVPKAKTKHGQTASRPHSTPIPS